MNASITLHSTCSCANSLLLVPGNVCEICMGVAKEVAQSYPVDTHYGVDYFEALEEQYSKEDLAA